MNMTYDWFCNTIGEGVIEAINTYFENNFTISLTSINKYESIKDDPLLRGELFYTCRISIKNKQHVTLRVTSDFIRINFHDTFGSSSPVFDLEKLTELDEKQRDALLRIPNTPDENIPIGADDSANVEIKRWGEPTKFDFEFKAHWDLCPELNMLDFERGVKLAHTRFTLYRNFGASP